MRCQCQLWPVLLAAAFFAGVACAAAVVVAEDKNVEEVVLRDEKNDQVEPEQDKVDAESMLVSLLTIALSGIGDKTFLLAAILSMKHRRLIIFAGAFSALALMAVLSCWLGYLVPRNYTDLFAAILFFASGLRMMWECWRNHQEQRQRGGGGDTSTSIINNSTDEEKQRAAEDRQAGTVTQENDLQIFLQTFALTFLGEWGDKSQISTIALAASNDFHWVPIGIIMGHAVCTGMAVLGGRMLASAISVQTVTLFGAILFLTFGSMSTFHYIFSTRGN